MSAAPVLFAGPGSARLEAIALDRASRLLCRRGHARSELECSDCRRVTRREHPDLVVVAPERRRWVNAPAFDEASESKETTIPTALVRALVAEASRAPYEGDLRVIALLDVDKTDAAAFSALLKVLEEPPPRLRFLLTATRPRFLPPTILSRVSIETRPGTSSVETRQELERAGVRAEEAAARAAFRPSDAVSARELDLEEARAQRDALLLAASGLFLTERMSWGVALGAALAGENAAETADRLSLLAQLLRDAVAAVASPQAVTHRERLSDLQALGAAPAARLLDAAHEALERASALADSRWNPRLSAEAFALSLVSGR